MDGGTGVIYEASFEFDGIFVKADILVRCGDGWEIHEVKSSTEVKDEYLDDLAVQDYVVRNAGLRIDRLFLVHIDNSYVRHGAIDVQRLFASQDVTAEARARQAELPGLIERLRATLAESSEPAIDIGLHCHKPYDCDLIPWCWRHIPADSVFDLSGYKKDKFALYYDGYANLADVPLERLKEKQRFEALATINRQDHVDHVALRKFPRKPLVPALPPRLRDLQLCRSRSTTTSVPISRSLSSIRCTGRHHPMLPSITVNISQGQATIRAANWPSSCSPRYLLMPVSSPTIKPSRSGCLSSLAELFPDLAEELRVRINNVRDLMAPFQSRAVYRWPMKGSYSIKQVLPAMVPELSYQGMAIADGTAAMRAYQEMCATQDAERLAEIRRGLLEYCGMDTWGMVRILAALRNRI